MEGEGVDQGCFMCPGFVSRITPFPAVYPATRPAATVSPSRHIREVGGLGRKNSYTLLWTVSSRGQLSHPHILNWTLCVFFNYLLK